MKQTATGRLLPCPGRAAQPHAPEPGQSVPSSPGPLLRLPGCPPSLALRSTPRRKSCLHHFSISLPGHLGEIGTSFLTNWKIVSDSKTKGPQNLPGTVRRGAEPETAWEHREAGLQSWVAPRACLARRAARADRNSPRGGRLSGETSTSIPILKGTISFPGKTKGSQPAALLGSAPRGFPEASSSSPYSGKAR